MSTSPSLLIHNVIVYAATQPTYGWVWCQNGKIHALDRGEPPTDTDAQWIDGHHQHLLPGFVDIHVHGAANADTMDATPEALQTMAQFYAQHGVTSFLATTWTDSHDRINTALDNVQANMGGFENGATLRGVHLEGPYLNPEKSGAQNTSHIRLAERKEAINWLNRDVIRLVSIAPEYPENHWLIEECHARGVAVSVAHTAATYEDVVHAHTLGLRHSTHTFNAMTGLHHRQPGVVGAVLSIPDITCELIADNIHVHPAAMRLLWNAKNFQNVALITDAIRAAGMPSGTYPVDEREIIVQDGVARLPDGTLAGSTLTMERALENFIHATGSTLENVYETTSLFPAESVGLDHVTGSITIGKDADLVLLDDAFNVRATIAQGRIVYQHP